MTGRQPLAKVIQLRRSSMVDPDAPFRPDRDAGLVKLQFAIDGRESFWGYHNPDERWNGWATPRFIREVAELIVDWVNTSQPGTAWWEGDTLHCVGGDGEYVDSIVPDELSLYFFDGWIWLEAETGNG